MNELEEKLKCAFSDAGAQIGELIRCMVAAEIAAHHTRISQLQAALDGSLCQEPKEFLDKPSGEVMPAA